MKKRILSLVTALAVVTGCSMTVSADTAKYGIIPGVYDNDMPETVIAEENIIYDTGSAEDTFDEEGYMTLDEAYEAAAGIDASDDPGTVGPVGIELSEDQARAVRTIVHYDQAGRESYGDYETASAVHYAAATNGSNTFYYNQLSTAQKTVYNKIASECQYFLNSSADASAESFAVIKLDSPMSKSQLYNTYFSFYLSNPQYFFLSTKFGYLRNSSGTYSGLVLMCYDNCRSHTSRETIRKSIQGRADTWIAGSSRYTSALDKETYFAKMIAESVDYVDTNYDQSMMGTLCYNKAVCLGYAQTLAYFCNRTGIPCFVIVGTNSNVAHAWNAVQIDGSWYLADVTFCDQGSYMIYEYLNRSSDVFLALDMMTGGDKHPKTDDRVDYSQFSMPVFSKDLGRNAIFTPAKPAVTASVANRQITYRWNNVSGATSYRVYRYYPDTKKYAYIGATTGTAYTATGLTNGATYGYLVRAFSGNTGSAYTAADVVYAVPAFVPAKPAVTAISANRQITYRWNAVSGATSYRVYRYYPDTRKYAYIGSTTATSYTASGLTNGTRYGYLVRAFSGNTGSAYTAADVVYATPTFTPSKPAVTAHPGNRQITLRWGAVSGATSYRVYRYDPSTKAYSFLGNTTSVSYTVSGLSNGAKYGFLVRAFSGNCGSSYTASDVVYAIPRQ